MIERKIIQGLITSTVYIKDIRPIWNANLLESSTAKLISLWCIEFFDRYKEAPGKNIETIFFTKLKNGMDKDIAEEIEEDILPGLSEEYEETGINAAHLSDITIEYFKERQYLAFSKGIESILLKNDGGKGGTVNKVEEYINNFKFIKNEESGQVVDFSKTESKENIRNAFKTLKDPVIRFPKQLGKFLNDQLYPGAFVGILAPEKRFKTFWLLEFAIRGCRQNKKVAFFQAGDMNEADQIKRIGMRLCNAPDSETYANEYYRPVRDCLRNQFNACDKKERECDFGIFSEDEFTDDADLFELQLTKDQLVEAYELNSEDNYRPCYNCAEYDKEKLGAPWLEKVAAADPITDVDVIEAADAFFIKYNRQFKLATYANGTLSVNMIESCLTEWEQEDGFIADVILIDYLELLKPSKSGEHRQEQNQIAKDIRKLSQTPRKGILPLIIAPTQADAGAYDVSSLKLKNFSEDKRKYAHVTSMIGINQDPKGIEKAIGITRLNELIKRVGDFNQNNQVTVLQDISRAKAFTSSYFSRIY